MFDSLTSWPDSHLHSAESQTVRNFFYIFLKMFWALPFIRTTIFFFYSVLQYGPFCPLLLYLLLLNACPAAYCCYCCCSCCCSGRQVAPFCYRLLQLLSCQGLPLAAPLLLQLLLLQNLGRTIVCSGVLPSPRLELTTAISARAN